MLQRLCLGFTSYRLETLPLAREEMRRYKTIVLEEPQTPGFEEMLRGEISVQDYLLLTDFAFVRFAEDSCELMRLLHGHGASILQIDPYMDELVRIHEYFASGGSPAGIEADTLTGQVYACERIWTGRLLEFYKASRGESFRGLVESVKNFARIDAERGIFRNRLRAEGLEDLFTSHESIYVETGYLHLSLQRELLARLPEKASLRRFHVLEPVMRRMVGKKQLFTPGDRLTFKYAFKKSPSEAKTDTLAAQSLIYNKIVSKEELVPTDSEPFPHAGDEIRAVSLAQTLSFDECGALFGQIRAMPTDQALEAVRRWLASRGGRN